MTTSSNASETERLIEEARREGRREGRWEERWKHIEAARKRSKELMKELDYWAEMARREGR